ncbi:elongation factor G [Calorimonas adulescens]|uniref:Elongation factor G n=1 Tax=Calorimonas adulescens TaxID=2606906 RepID=A0A5D8Q8K0_9THEO|nr:elongation factor G [Calorimonas adulescens]TZE80707.1 elongation factor G [Calorimonas adulescens]
MKGYKPTSIRNAGIFAHGGAGKTTLSEALLYEAKAIDRMGRVSEGNTTMDYDPEEIQRQVSVSCAIAPLEWRDTRINLIDTPGYFDFEGDVVASLKAVDFGIVVVCASSGVEVGTEKVWTHLDKADLPKVVFINKMDRENANFDNTLSQLKDVFGNSVVALALPIGREAGFKGYVDLLSMKAFIRDGNKMRETAIPDDMADTVSSARDILVEAIAGTDEGLMEKFFDGEELTCEELKSGLKAALLNRDVVPVLVGAGQQGIGTDALLDFIVDYAPSPVDRGPVKGIDPSNGQEIFRKPEEAEPFSAFVFKTIADPFVGRLSIFRVVSGEISSDTSVYNPNKDTIEKLGQLYLIKGKKQIAVDRLIAGDIGAVSKLVATSTSDTLCDVNSKIKYPPIEFPEPSLEMAIEPKSKGDEEKINSGLSRLTEEDPTFIVERNVETGQTIIKGMGELHIEVIAKKLMNKFGVDCVLTQPKIPYRETIRGKAHVEGKHKKQTGGHGQYGHVWIDFEPTSEGDFIFEEKIFGGAVPKQYIPAVEKGLRESIKEGVLAGYPVVNVKATLVDGSYHPVDSSEMSFKIAASLAFKKGMEQADPVLLEPVMHVEVLVPEDYMGDVIGDINRRRGRILGMEPKDGLQLVIAEVPLAEMYKYGADLRSFTHARGSFKMWFERYEEVPAHIAEKIIEKARAEKEEER